MQTRKGTIPNDANGFIAVNEETGWTIYRRAASAAPWVSIKVAHLEPIKGAANYWLGWHAGDARLSHSVDTTRLTRDHPDVMTWVLEVMVELYPTLTEEDMAL